jgi:hypothetical protein
VHILQELRFCGGRITTQENVDFTSEATPTSRVQLFADTAKKLSKDTFLYVLILPNARCQRIYQQVVDIVLLCELSELGYFNIRKNSMILVQALVSHHSIVFDALFVHLLIAEQSCVSFLSICVLEINSAFV